MTPDKAHRDTDRELAALERRVRSVYREAQQDVQAKMDAFTARHEAKDKDLRKQLADGKITQSQYRAWQQGQVFQGKQWRAKLDQITATLNHANVVAQGIINGRLNGVFANNANWQSYLLEHGAGINFGFSAYDADTVARLLRDEPELLPKSRVNIPKDKRWNQKIITQQIAQGVIQGEGIAAIGKRMEQVTDRNKNLSLTRARTAMTGAENAGRQESLTRAKGKGIKVKKEWVSTLDGRTRHSHRLLDGQKVDLDQDFDAEGFKIRFPGDPRAHPAMVYNCRCTMVGDLEDYPDEYNAQRYDNIDGVKVADMSYSDWEKAKQAGQQIPSRREKPVEKPVETVVFIPAETIKAAEAYAAKFAQSVSYKGAKSVDRVNEVNRTLGDLQSQYPTDSMDSLTTNGRLRRANAQANFRTLEINTSFLNGHDTDETAAWADRVARNKEKLVEYKGYIGDAKYDQRQLKKVIGQLEEEIKYDRWSVGDGNLRLSIAHEYGHVVADQYFGQINGNRANPNFSYDRDNPAQKQVQKVNDVYKKAVKSGDIQKISMYASTNSHEFFAETFAMKFNGEKLPEYISEMLDEVIKNGKL